MHRSLSLHGSSLKYPRAIVFGGDGRMIVSFNDGHLKNFARMEVMCFQPTTATFEFHDIAFPKESSEPIEDLTEQQNRRPFVISQPNGTSATDCRMCHSSPTKPNWETYHLWPGAFGCVDDELFADGYEKYTSVAENFHDRYGRLEAEAWKKFQFKGRYQVLNPMAPNERPNLLLGEALSRMNGIRIVKELKRLGPSFAALKQKFARAMYCPLDEMESRTISLHNLACPDTIPVYVPTAKASSQFRSMIRQSLDHFSAKANYLALDFSLNSYPEDCGDQETGQVYAALGLTGEKSHLQGQVHLPDLARLSRIRNLVEPLGINVKNWSLVVLGGYEFEDGSDMRPRSTFVRQIQQPFLDAFFPQDEKLRSLIGAMDDISGDPNFGKYVADVVARENEICKYLNL